MNMKKLPVDVLIAKRRILMLCAAMVAFAAMTACKSEISSSNNESLYTAAPILDSVWFDCSTAYDSIDAAIRASSMPLHVEWDEDGVAWLAIECEIPRGLVLSDSNHYLCNAECLVIDGKEWVAITFTEDITGQYWMYMWPKNECGLVHETGMFDEQAEPYTILDHFTEDGNMIVRYSESKTFDTIQLAQTFD